jgi:hypothetical protein
VGRRRRRMDALGHRPPPRALTAPPLSPSLSPPLHPLQAIASASGSDPGEVSAQDVLLAIQAHERAAFAAPPPAALLTRLAAARNAAPLPEPRERRGLRLPPEGECLLTPGLQLEAGSGGGAAPAAALDAATAAARGRGDHGVRARGGLEVAAPGEGWRPPPDAPAEPWPEGEAPMDE